MTRQAVWSSPGSLVSRYPVTMSELIRMTWSISVPIHGVSAAV